MPRLAVLAVLLATAAPAAAAEPGSPPARYAFQPVAGGVLRLDTETGQVSLCVGGERAPVCTRAGENVRLTVPERVMLEARIAELETRVAALQAREPEMPAADEAAMGRVKMLAVRMLRHFVGAVRAVRRDIEGDEPKI